MTQDDVLQELELMRAAGLRPLLCDTKVPLVDVPVLAGQPAEAGDATQGEYVLLPCELVGRHPVFLIDVEGLSMRDAGIMPGDRLEVQMDSSAADGDIVVAEVDGSYTVKTLFTDNEGLRWLVPGNASFAPILLSGCQWRIIGKVIGLRKGMPRTPYADCAKAVSLARQQQAGNQSASTMRHTAAADQPANLVFKAFANRRRIDFAAIRQRVERVVVMQMKSRYEWYAAYRMLFDLNLLEDVRLSRFALQMRAWFPEVPIACNADSLGIYAVGHTSKAFRLWNVEDFRTDKRPGQSLNGFITLYHRCEELRAQLFPLPVEEPELPV